MKKNASVKLAGKNLFKNIAITSDQKPEIEEATKRRWKRLLDLLTAAYKMKASLIMKISEEAISVFLTGENEINLFRENERQLLGKGLYCETVLGEAKSLYVKNALEDDIWKDNPDVKKNMTSYFGIPLKWPDGEFFGTLCVLDSKEIPVGDEFSRIIMEFGNSVEKDLEILSEKKKLKFEMEKAQLFLEIPGNIVLALDTEANITFVNYEGGKILGYTEDELINHNWFELFVPENKLEKAKKVYSSIINGEKKHLDIDYKPLKTKSGETRIICWHNSLCRDENGRVIGTISSGRDTTDEFYLRKTIDFEKEMFSQIAENIGEILWIKDTETDSMIFINSLYEQLWGRSKKEIYGDAKSFMYNVHPEDRKRVEDAYEFMKSSGTWRFDEEFRIIREDGEILWFKSRTFPVHDEDGSIYRSVGVAENITPKKEMEKKLSDLALIDDLTGIYNRRYFFSKGDEEFSRAKRYKHEMSVMMLDIDYFKKVNDSFGHHYGDLTLKEFCKSCTNSLRKTDIFGRIGGEEFAVILPETDEYSCSMIAERLKQNVEEMVTPAENGEIRITTSIGISSLRKSDSDFEEIVKRADKALYRAKDAGRNKVMIGI